MSRPPVYHNGYRGGQYRDEAFVRGEARGRPSQSAFSGPSGARGWSGQYVGDGRGYGGAPDGRQGPRPAFTAPRHVQPAPPAPPYAASTSRPFTFGAASTASFNNSVAPFHPPRRSAPSFHPRSPSPATFSPTPPLSHRSPTDLPPSPPLTLPLPSRLASPSLDPGPLWLTEALYGPSHEEMCAWRKRAREEEEEEGEGRGWLGGWDWESWEREKRGRKRVRRD
ncbi:hypothetical protein BJY59DRAFT_691217 [Rhodotorula toruloides]